MKNQFFEHKLSFGLTKYLKKVFDTYGEGLRGGVMGNSSAVQVVAAQPEPAELTFGQQWALGVLDGFLPPGGWLYSQDYTETRFWELQLARVVAACTMLGIRLEQMKQLTRWCLLRRLEQMKRFHHTEIQSVCEQRMQQLRAAHVF